MYGQTASTQMVEYCMGVKMDTFYNYANFQYGPFNRIWMVRWHTSPSHPRGHHYVLCQKHFAKFSMQFVHSSTGLWDVRYESRLQITNWYVNMIFISLIIHTHSMVVLQLKDSGINVHRRFPLHVFKLYFSQNIEPRTCKSDHTHTPAKSTIRFKSPSIKMMGK